MLIYNHEIKTKRSEKATQSILRHLRDHPYSSAYILSQVAEVSERGIYKRLKMMEKKGFLHTHKYKGIPFKIWGITRLGLAYAWSENEEMEIRKPFQPGKVKSLMIFHELELQQAKINAEKAGWTDWTPGNLLHRNIKKRADAIVKNKVGELIGVELERTIKSRRRISVIFSNYLQMIKKGEIEEVHYVCPDLNFAKKLQRVFGLIRSVPVNGNQVTLKEAHRSKFIVFSLDDWPQKIIDTTQTLDE